MRIAYEDLSIEEIFFGLYETSITTNDALITILKDVLLRMQLDINKCRGQCYDGAANVSGHVAGLRSKVLEKESLTLHVHCRAHKLNLAAHDAMNNNEEIRSIMVLVQELTAFIRGSHTRLAWFSHFKDEDEENMSKSLRPFCPTRWTMRFVSIQAITSNYAAIFSWFKEVNAKERNATGIKAGGFLKVLKKCKSFFLLEILRMVFTIIEGGSTTLQGIQLSFCKSDKAIKYIRQSVLNARTDARFVCIWQSILHAVASNGSIKEPKSPRQHKVPRRIDEGTEASFFPTTTQDPYRHKCFTILDCVLFGLTDQLEPDKTSEHLKKVQQFLIGEEKSVEYIKEYYHADVDGPRLVLHIDMIIDRARCQGTQLEDTQCVVDFLIKDEMFRSVITELSKLVRIILTLPVSSCTAERSFSGLRRLKTYLRSRMSQ